MWLKYPINSLMEELLKAVIESISPSASSLLEVEARRRLDSLTKPPGSLGRLEDLAVWFCLARGHAMPDLPRPGLFVFCADHGVTEEGVSAYPSEVTSQMALNFAAAGAAVNVLARHGGMEATVVDVGVRSDLDPSAGVLDRKVARGTANLARESAMTRAQAEQALLTGAQLAKDAADQGVTLLLGGEMGIGNTTAAAAVGAGLLNLAGSDLAGSGTGIDPGAVSRKADTVDRALHRSRVSPDDPLGVLTELGGFEIAALVGLMLGGAARRVPTVVDGFIATAAALAAVRLSPACRGYLEFGHRSAEQGHRLMLDALDARPLLDLGMRLGEGTGAVLAAELVTRAVALYREMATFESAGVSDI